VPKSLEYIPGAAVKMSAAPDTGRWQTLEIPLEKIGATDKLLDGVGFLHDGGRVLWGPTTLEAPDGKKKVLWVDPSALPDYWYRKVNIHVDGLKAGTRVRVLFEDRDIIANDGHFTDDFRGQDLYQRHGGGAGYGNTPVALHLYEIP
jgi:hypothetical protein